MRREFAAIVEQDGPWFVAFCAEPAFDSVVEAVRRALTA